MTPHSLPEMVIALSGHPLFAAAQARLIPVGNCALTMSVSPPSGCPMNWIDVVAQAAGWTTDAVRPNKAYRLEPSITPELRVKQLFHVSSASNTDAILAQGLIPSASGMTWMNRTYPDRIFFARTIWDAFVFLDSKALQRPCIGGPGELEGAQLVNWEVFRVTADRDRYPLDPWMDGAVWTNEAVPPERVKIAKEWRDKYSEAAGWRTAC